MPHSPVIEREWRPEHHDGQIVVWAFGWRVRFYLGHSFADRPRLHFWRADGHRGIVLRRRRGVAGQPVLGIQWRRADAS